MKTEKDLAEYYEKLKKRTTGFFAFRELTEEECNEITEGFEHPYEETEEPRNDIEIELKKAARKLLREVRKLSP